MLSFLFNTNVIMNHDNSFSDSLKASLSHYFNEVNMESGINFVSCEMGNNFLPIFLCLFRAISDSSRHESENTHVTWHDTLNEVGFITVSQEDSDVFFSFVIWRCRNFRWQVSLIFPLTLLSFYSRPLIKVAIKGDDPTYVSSQTSITERRHKKFSIWK